VLQQMAPEAPPRCRAAPPRQPRSAPSSRSSRHAAGRREAPATKRRPAVAVSDRDLRRRASVAEEVMLRCTRRHAHKTVETLLSPGHGHAAYRPDAERRTSVPACSSPLFSDEALAARGKKAGARGAIRAASHALPSRHPRIRHAMPSVRHPPSDAPRHRARMPAVPKQQKWFQV